MQPKLTTDFHDILDHNYIDFFIQFQKLLSFVSIVSNLNQTETLTSPDYLTDSGKLNSSIQFQLHYEIHQIQKGTPEAEAAAAEGKRKKENFVKYM